MVKIVLSVIARFFTWQIVCIGSDKSLMLIFLHPCRDVAP
jgi:hypothetical protein